MHLFVHGFVDTVKSKLTELYLVTLVIEIINHKAYNSALMYFTTFIDNFVIYNTFCVIMFELIKILHNNTFFMCTFRQMSGM